VTFNPVNEQAFGDAALQHWELLGRELRQDIEAFKREKGGSALFEEVGPTEYRVSSPDSGLEARISADPASHIVRYEFIRMNDNSAGAPEGGILSMRRGANGVEFFSADEPVTSSEARSLLLDPLLNPPGSKAA
jgi:hypothetical protein